MKPHTIRPKDMLDTLTSFRFFAALLVFAAHVAIFTGWNYFQGLNLGYDGVGFFYMLSGFILTYVYIDKLKKPKRADIKRFYISRIAKVYPVHLLTFIAAILLAVTGVASLFPEHTRRYLIEAVVANLTLTQSWIPNPAIFFSFNGVSWSISVELFFYAVFPLLIFLVGRYDTVLTLKRILLGAAFVWIVMLCLYMGYHASDNDWKLYVLPVARIPEFIAGILLERVFVMTKGHPVVKDLFGRKNATRVEIGSVMVLVGAIAVTMALPLSITFSLWLLPAWALIIFTFAQQKGRLSLALQNKSLLFLGNISFSFYMVHQLVIRYLTLAGLTPFAMILLSFIVSLVISSLVYVMYEEPMRLKMKAWLERIAVHKKHISPLGWAKMIRGKVKEF